MENIYEALKKIEKEAQKYKYTYRHDYGGNTGAYVAGLKWAAYKIHQVFDEPLIDGQTRAPRREAKS